MNPDVLSSTVRAMLLSILSATLVFFPPDTARATSLSECKNFLGHSQGTSQLPSSNQLAIVSSLSAGSTVQFDDGVSYTIEAVLSTEGNDGIFRISNNRVLRLSKSPNGLTINRYFDGYEPLLKEGI